MRVFIPGYVSGLILCGLLAGCSNDGAGTAETAVSPSTNQTTDTSAVTAADGEGVKFRMAGPTDSVILVPVMINGKGPYTFVLDTGATFTCVDTELAKSLQLPKKQGMAGIKTGVRGTGQVELVNIPSIQVGSAEVENLMGCTIQMEHLQSIAEGLQGLLGLNFLKQFEVTLDFQENRLLLKKP